MSDYTLPPGAVSPIPYDPSEVEPPYREEPIYTLPLGEEEMLRGDVRRMGELARGQFRFQVSDEGTAELVDLAGMTQDPVETLAKINSAAYLARFLDEDPAAVFHNFDAYSQGYWGKIHPPKRAWEAIKDEGRIANIALQLNSLGWRAGQPWVTPTQRAEIMRKIDSLEAQMPPPDEIKRKLPVAILKAARGLVPFMAHVASAGAITAATGAIAAATTAAVIGQVPPLTVLPEEAVTIPIAAITAFGIMQIAGSAIEAGRLEAGATYIEARREGIDPNVAQLCMIPTFVLNGLIETANLSVIFRGIPGGKEVAQRAILRLTKNTLLRGLMKAPAARAMARFGLVYGGEMAVETAQEIVQEAVTISSVELGKIVSDEVAGTDLEGATAQQITERLLNVVDQSAKGFALIALPGAMGRSAALERAAKPGRVLQERVERLTEIADVTRPAAERVAEIQGRLLDLNVAQRELAPKVDLENVTEIDDKLAGQIQEFRRNEFEINYLKMLEREEGANSPGALWRQSSEELRPAPVRIGDRGPAVEDALDPESRVRGTIRDVTPQVPEDQADVVAMLWAGFAHVEGVELGDWVNQHFVPEIARQAELPPGKKGAVTFLEGGKALLEMSAKSDFSTWVHETFHVVFEGLSDERRAGAVEWAGAVVREDGTVDWQAPVTRTIAGKERTQAAHEWLAEAFEVYLREGRAPTPFLEELFRKIAEWLNAVYHAIGQRWELSDDIRTWYGSLLIKPESGVAKVAKPKPTRWPPTALAPREDLVQVTLGKDQAIDETMIFQTDPAPAEWDPAFDEAIRTFGVTDDIREGGYILPDGRMLDFSGRHMRQDAYKREGDLWIALDRDPASGLRAVNHAQIFETMEEFSNKGAIRMDGKNGTVYLTRRPTARQEAVIRQIAEANDFVSVGFPPDRDASRYFGSEAPAMKLVGAIRRFFATGELPVQCGQTLFQTDPEANPHLAADITGVKEAIAGLEKRITELESGAVPERDLLARQAVARGEVQDLIGRSRAMIEALLQVTDKGVMFAYEGLEEFKFHIIHRSTIPEEQGRWRVTHFDHQGPYGHAVGDLVGLIRTQMMAGAKLIKTRGQRLLPRERRLFQRDPEEQIAPWYLRSEETIRAKMQGPMPGKQILSMLENAGIKQDELQWTGLAVFLDTTKKVTPQEVLDQIASERPQLGEILKGDRPAEQKQRIWELREDVEWAHEDAELAHRALRDELKRRGVEHQQASTLAREYGMATMSEKDAQLVDQTLGRMSEDPVEAARARDLLDRTIGTYEASVSASEELRAILSEAGPAVRYAPYQLLGGEKYRELLLTLPAVGREPTFEEWWSQTHIDTPEGANERVVRMAREQYEREKASVFRVGVYRSPHWDELNVLLNVRFNERIDTEGRRMLFLEEIQGDWHQQARRVGYRAPALSEAELERWRSLGQKAATEITEEEHEELRALSERKVGRGVPAAPFAKTWHELAFRRMARWAAEDGFELLGWTTGEQQIGRYNLAERISAILYEPATGEVEVLDLEGDPMTAVPGVMDQKLLRRYFGKAITNRLLSAQPDADGWVRVTGDDLEIGGEGMREFYDRMLPSYARKFGKRWKAAPTEALIPGARQRLETEEEQLNVEIMEALREAGVGEARAQDIATTWPEGGREEAFRVAPQALRKYEEGWERLRAATVHALEITDAMRESIINEGQPLFQTDPHLDEVLDAIRDGMPVPDRVLVEYSGVAAVAEEIGRRQILMDHARTVKTAEEFLEWMLRAHADRPATEAYYRMIHERSLQAEDPLEMDRFASVLDQKMVADIMAEIQFVEGDNPESDLIKALTPEMIELGKAALSGTPDPELVTTVREQILGDVEKWRGVLKVELHEALGKLSATLLPKSGDSLTGAISEAESEATAPTDFHPLTARIANARFLKMLDEGGLETFAGDIYHTEKLGARAKGKRGGWHLPVALKIAASQALGGRIGPVERRQAMAAIRRDAPGMREVYAAMYEDREMMMQLDWEIAHRDEAEDMRLRKANTKLREELKKLRGSGKVAAPDNTDQTIAKLQEALRARQKALDEAQGAIDQARAKATDLEARARARDEIEAETPLAKAYRRQMEILENRMVRMQQARTQEMVARAETERAEKLRLYVFRPVMPATGAHEGRMIEDIQMRLAPVPDEVDAGMLSRVREWRRRNPDAALPSDLVRDIEARKPREMTLGEFEEVAEEIKRLRSLGWRARQAQLAGERELIQSQRDLLLAGWQGPPKKPPVLGTRASQKPYKTAQAKRLLWGTWRMNRISDMADEGRKYPDLVSPAGLKMLASQMMIPEETLRGMGPTFAWLSEAVNDGTTRMLTQARRVFMAQEQFLKDHKITARMLGRQEVFDGDTYTHGEMIGVYIYQQFDKGWFSLVNDNNISATTIGEIATALTPDEKAYGDWMIDTLSSDQEFDRLLDAQIDFHNQWMERVDRYFPFQRGDPTGGQFLSEIVLELLEMRGFARRQRAPGMLITRKERTPGVKFSPLRLDAPSIFSSHVNKREFFIANAQLMKRLLRIFDIRDIRTAMTEKWGDAMPSLVGKYISAAMNQNIYRTHEDWAQMGRLWRTNVSVGLIAYNTMTILRNLCDIPMIMVQAGPIDAINAAGQMIRAPLKTIRFLQDKVPEFFVGRSYDRFTEELATLDRDLYQRMVRKVGRAGFLGLYATDFVTNSLGGLAVYNKTMRQTGNDEVASRAARDFLLKKRPSARAKDVAQFYRESGTASWFLLFTNQLNQQWNIMTYDIPTGIRKGFTGDSEALVDALVQVTALMVGGVAMAIVERKRLPEGVEWAKDLLAWIFGNAPFVGYAMEQGIREQYFGGALYPFAGAYETVGAAKVGLQVITGGADMERATREAMNALFGLMRGFGLPAVQARRVYRTIETGDPWALIGGPPKAPKE